MNAVVLLRSVIFFLVILMLSGAGESFAATITGYFWQDENLVQLEEYDFSLGDNKRPLKGEGMDLKEQGEINIMDMVMLEPLEKIDMNIDSERYVEQCI